MVKAKGGAKSARRTRGAAKSDVENLEEPEAAVMEAKRLSPISPAAEEGSDAAVMSARAVRKRGTKAVEAERLDGVHQAKKKPLAEGNAQVKEAGARPQRKAAPKVNMREASASAEKNKQSKEEEEEEDFQPARKRKSGAAASKPPRPLPMSSCRISMAGLSRAEKEEAAAELPVITSPQGMFFDMVTRCDEFRGFAKAFDRPLRVATMCSGTESPLLALEMISKACKQQHSTDFKVEHVFSCEIEPFKQGYIERNFAPPILFRDIRELGNKQATTAYGAMVDVPGNVDMLVAGTSCVDYSNLNNQKQDIDAKGESGQTFRGMMTWVEKNQPPIVILENVCSAPWQKVKDYFRQHGYAAEFMRVDTKQYYIPHTRTRVYLVAFNESLCPNADELAKTWVHMVKDMERPSSSTLEAFLLPSDDPRVHKGRERLAIPKERGATGTDWSRCESRHQRARMDEELGNKRPYTSWEAQGSCKLPDYAWNDWALVQTERVMDLLDIDYLRLAGKDTDAAYKTLVWNLSQNVDRTTGSVKPGICPCLTPTMVPFVTNRGGPLIGLEALSLQGIPVDDLLLTRQTEDQLADLAGNAMTSTVVGTCMMAALSLAHGNKLLPETRPDIQRRTLPERAEVKVVGEENLSETGLPLDSISNKDFSALLQEANKSAQLCVCEGREGMAQGVRKCQDCNATTCRKCGGRPEHNFEDGIVCRIPPQSFAVTLKSALPMRLRLNGLEEDVLKWLKPKDVDASLWKGWMEAVKPLGGAEFCFRTVKRSDVWTATYTSAQSLGAVLELVLDSLEPRWQVSVEPPRERGPLRDALSRPVVRVALDHDGSLLSGRTEVFVPDQQSFDVKITGKGELVETWQASLGLKKEFEGAKRWSQWHIQVPKKTASFLSQDVSGTYSLLDKCGHAGKGLHKREAPAPGENDLFMFLDPSRCAGPETDHFVFATSHRRLAYKEDRNGIAALDAKWRPGSSKGAASVPMHVAGVWKRADRSGLAPVSSAGAVMAMPSGPVGLDVSDGACQTATAVLNCRVPLTEEDSHVWPADEWETVNLERSKATFEELAWLTDRLSLPEPIQEWNEPLPQQQQQQPAEKGKGKGKKQQKPQEEQEQENEKKVVKGCSCCAPPQPGMRWVFQNGKMVAREDPMQAADYECKIKIRPSPFVVRLKHDTKSKEGEMHVAVNSRTLVNRSLAELPHAPSDDISVSWRVVQHRETSGSFVPEKFVLKSNRGDKPPKQPPHFKKYPLRPEQLRSLGWMLQQEETAEPYVEEEVSEAILPALGWRAEGKAQKSLLIRGGVLADQVGYGKTAVTVGLIDSKLGAPLPEAPDGPRSVPVKGTLVLVPPHLMNQWPAEINKFTGSNLKVEVMKTVGDLGRMTVKQLKEADVVVVASSVLRSQKYYERLAQLTGVGEGLVKAKTASHFASCYSNAMEKLGEQAELLQGGDTEAALDNVRGAKDRLRQEAQAAPQVGTKRLKGKQLLDATEAKEKAAEANKDQPDEAQDTKQQSKKQKSAAAKDTKAAEKKAAKGAEGGAEADGWTVNNKPPKWFTESFASLGWTALTKTEGKKRLTKYLNSDGAVCGTTMKECEAALAAAEEGGSNGSAEAEESVEEEEAAPTPQPRQKRKAAPAKAKKATKAKATPVGARSSSRSRSSKAEPDYCDDSEYNEEESEESDYDSDEAEESPAKKKPAKKKAKKAGGSASLPVDCGDPWGLTEAAVKKDWEEMRSPPLEMFHWTRIVVDEFTYLNNYDKIAIQRGLKGSARWVLSGTPPHENFDNVKSISCFLGIQLGCNDGKPIFTKAEQTKAQTFQFYQDVHTQDWHLRRHKLAQAFLDRFLRQNIAEIDEIAQERSTVDVNLLPVERAIYLELDHHMQALDMKGGKKKMWNRKGAGGDRVERLKAALGASDSPEEALLKRCAHFDLSGESNTAIQACKGIVKTREDQLEQCKAELVAEVAKGWKLMAQIRNTDSEYGEGNDQEQDVSFLRWVGLVNSGEGGEDTDATEILKECVELGKQEGQGAVGNGKAGKGKKGKAAPKGDSDEAQNAKGSSADDLKWDLREHTHGLRRLDKELVGRVRSLRYFQGILRLSHEDEADVPCSGCGKSVKPDQQAILSTCGHIGCVSCLTASAGRLQCVEHGCKAAIRPSSVVHRDQLGTDEDEAKGGGRYGSKIKMLIEAIKATDATDRVLVFVQFKDLMQTVADALEISGIKALQLKGTSHQKSNGLEAFQRETYEEGDPKVLLLNVRDESASGANLTTANHAFFVHPLLVNSDQEYHACLTQAMGRVVRFGQTKKVNIRHFLAAESIDTEIHAERHPKGVAV